MSFEALVWTIVALGSLIVIGGFAIWVVRGDRDDLESRPTTRG